MDSISLLPQFGGVFMTVIAFIVALSVIVAIHEYGHYIVGRWSGIKADVFSLGFGPVLWSRVDRLGTRWQVALLPFGGYVKFMGDANAASAGPNDEVQEMAPEKRRQTMLGAPLWARTATVSAGPVFNFVLSILIFATVLMMQGRIAEPLTVGEIRPLPFEEITLEPGDELIEIAGRPVPAFDEGNAFDDFIESLPRESVLDYQVRRNDSLMSVRGPHPMPPLATQLSPQSAAYEAGIKAGDVITAVDGDPVAAFSELRDIVESSDGRPIQIDVWRDGTELELALIPRRVDEPQPDGGFRSNWRIGIAGGFAFVPATETMGPGTALVGGVAQTWAIITGSVSGIYHMVTGAISSCNMSGPIGIAEVSGAMASQGVESFVWFIAVLSAAVGFLNLLPIPILDGGHLVFYAYEAVTGKPPSDFALRVLMAAGLALVLGLMAFALTNDLFCP